MKGFILRGIDIQDKQALSSVPILATYRANIGGDNAFNIQSEGDITLYTSSSSAKHFNNPARISMTCVFVASNQNIFAAEQRIKGRMSRVECNCAGFKGHLQDKGGNRVKDKKPSTTKNPLNILKTRLAKGEITLQQYEELRKAIDSG